MVAVPDREEPRVFCVQETVAPADPLPLAGDTVSHEPLPAVVQLPPVHPAGTPVTLTPADPLSDVGLADVGLIEKLVHVGDEVPLCVTEKLWPAIVALPERDDADVF